MVNEKKDASPEIELDDLLDDLCGGGDGDEALVRAVGAVVNQPPPLRYEGETGDDAMRRWIAERDEAERREREGDGNGI